jgi:hypothetical protein
MGIKHFTNKLYELKYFKYIVLFESILSWYEDDLNVGGWGIFERAVCC